MTRRALITCCPGSGSTVFAHLLNAHPNMLSVNEVQIHKAFHKGRFKRFMDKRFFTKSSLGKDTPDLTGDMWKTTLGPWSSARRYWAASRGEEALASYLLSVTAKQRVDCLADKLPNPRLIQTFANKNPGTRFIYLHRHPYAVINSILRKKATKEKIPGVTWGPRLKGIDEDMPKHRLAALMYGQCLTWLAEARAASINVHEVYYESFLADPVGVYWSVYEHLDLTCSASIRSSIEQMFEDSPLRAGRSDGWREELTDSIQDEIAEILDKFTQYLPEPYRMSRQT